MLRITEKVRDDFLEVAKKRVTEIIPEIVDVIAVEIDEMVDVVDEQGQ